MKYIQGRRELPESFFTISFIDVVEVNKKKIYLCQMRKNGKKYIENVK